jgi:hypothetical protein
MCFVPGVMVYFERDQGEELPWKEFLDLEAMVQFTSTAVEVPGNPGSPLRDYGGVELADFEDDFEDDLEVDDDFEDEDE